MPNRTHDSAGSVSNDGKLPLSRIRLVAFINLFVVGIALLTALDVGSSFVYLPYWPVAGCFLAALALFPFERRWRIKGTFLMIAAIWISILPSVRWNLLKSFYVDAQRLRVGMAMTEVEQIMKPYVRSPQGNLFGASMVGVQENQSERESRILFVPSMNHAADWCVVYPKEELVGRVEIHPD